MVISATVDMVLFRN